MECPSCGNLNREGARFCDSCGARLEPDQDLAGGTPGTSAPDAADRPESLVEGRYAVERFLGARERKQVFLARDTREGGHQVAVALFSTEGMAETARALARREAQAMGQLGSHPHIVGVHDSGEDRDRPYIASEYMPGGDLVDLLGSAPARRLEIERAVAIATDVCRGLEHAHARGIVHRDLKPANVWLDDSDRARIGDFGLAATGGRSREAVEGMVGTVAYLPPEQALGRPSDARADLYSLGCLIYEMLTGQSPFPGDDAVAIIGQHLNAEPVPPSGHNPEVPRGLDELILGLLAKSPDERPESAAAVRARLEAIATEPEAEDAAEEPENPLDRLAGGVFVGRERELEELRGDVDEALGGRGGLVLLVGEPGIGKSRTAEELATYARVRGAKVHWGRCHEGEGVPAYWPWAEAIRSYVREADPVGLAWELGARAADLVQVVPELRERVPDVSEPPATDPEQARFRLFDSVAGFLTGAARSRPIVLVLDDLHWADEASLLLLKFVARQLAGSALLLVGTYRDVELGRHHPLARTLGELSGLERSRRIALRGLELEATSRFIEMTTGTEPPPGLAEAVHAHTEGNPFFAGEVVRLLASEGALERDGAGDWRLEIPQGVREVIGQRLDRLSDEANAALTLAAAIGRDFDLAVLERICDRTRAQIAADLDEALEARVISERRASGRYTFSHALTRETLYAEISGPRRAEIHRGIGEALEDLYAADLDSRVAELAHHFLEASMPGGDAAKAIDYAERAAARATAQLAHEDAAVHLGHALEVLRTRPDRDRARELSLELELGETQVRAGRFAAARGNLEAAADLARQHDDPDALARAALGVSAVSEAGRKDERIAALITDALEAIGPGDSAVRARLLNGLAQEVYWEDPEGSAAALSREAVEIARRTGDDRALAAALGGGQFLEVGDPTGIETRLDRVTELLEVARRAGDGDLAVRAHAYRLSAYLQLGDIAAADRELETYARLAEELREPRHLWHVPMIRATRAMMEGRFDESRRLSREAVRLGDRAEEPLARQFHTVQMSILHTFEGTVEEMLPPVRQMAERYPAIVAWRMALVSFLTEAGRTDEARVEFERLAANEFEDIPRDAQWLVGIARLADAAFRIGDAERAAKLYEKLRPFAGQVVIAGRAAACNGPVDRYLGMLALALSRPADATAHLEAGVEIATRMGDRPMVADTRELLARALLARGRSGDRERALELLAGALGDAQELGMRTLIERGLATRFEAQGISRLDVTTSIDTVISAVESERPDIAAHAAPDGTVTILFSDIENSTLMTERLGDERWIEVLREHNSIFRERIRAHRGHEVKSQGDGFMLVFPSAAEGLACAAEVQRDLAVRDAPDDERIRVRIGLHAGEAIHEEGDFFGRTVILAARIAAQARGGEILVSESLRQRVVGDDPGPVAEADPTFDEGRELELKGLAGVHRVFGVGWERELAAA